MEAQLGQLTAARDHHQQQGTHLDACTRGREELERLGGGWRKLEKPGNEVPSPAQVKVPSAAGRRRIQR
jgi:hypothetical protein